MGFFGGGGASVSDMVGATTSNAGVSGLVPAPAAGKNTRALFSDASFIDSSILPRRSAENDRIVRFRFDAFGLASGGITQLVRHFVPIYIYADGNIDELVARTGSGTISSAFNIHLALWEMNESGDPSTYVIGGTMTSGTSTNTNLGVSVSSTAVKRGWHFISLTTDANAPTNGLSYYSTNSNLLALYMGSAAINDSSFIYRYTCATSYSQTTHETFVQAGGALMPNVGIRWVV